jgi:hypothetical protein
MSSASDELKDECTPPEAEANANPLFGLERAFAHLKDLLKQVKEEEATDMNKLLKSLALFWKGAR